MNGGGAGSDGRRPLDRLIHGAGVAYLGAFGALVPISFALGMHFPWMGPPRADRLSGAPALLPEGLRAALDGWAVGRLPLPRTFAVGGVVLVLTVAWVALALGLRAQRAQIESKDVRNLVRYAAGFGVVAALCSPLFQRDLWLSAVWGRMIAAGVNPYYAVYTPEFTAGVPFPYIPMRMTYGPLWAWIVGALSAVTGPRPVVEFLVAKALLTACWISLVLVVRSAARVHGPYREALAVCLVGWLPMSPLFTLVGGHNDVAMTLALAGWLWLGAAARPHWARVALLASVLLKYVTAPLMAVDLVHAIRTKTLRTRRDLALLALTAIGALAITVPFVRDLHAFDDLSTMNWFFLSPASALVKGAAALGIQVPARAAILLFRVAAAALVLDAGLRYWRDPATAQLRRLTLAILVAIVGAAISHIWPWFLIWPLAVAALCQPDWLVRLVVAAGLAAPLPNLLMLPATHPNWAFRPVTTLVFAAGTVTCFAAMYAVRAWPRNSTAPAPPDAPRSVRP